MEFELLFNPGLECCVRHFILPEGMIIGFSEKEILSMKNPESQRELLELLVLHTMPGRTSDILQFTRPGLVCLSKEGNDESSSHFMGLKQHPVEEAICHLATIHLDELPEHFKANALGKQLSFYIRKNELRSEWPACKDDYKVLYEQEISKTNFNPNMCFGDAVNIDFLEILDIPDYNHSLLFQLNFSDEEQEIYEAVKMVYDDIITNGMNKDDIIKLFGYPDAIQNCVAYEAELMFNQREYSDDFYQDAVEWELLLQVSLYSNLLNTSEDLGEGTLYFMIRKDDFKHCQFENCVLINQCT